MPHLHPLLPQLISGSRSFRRPLFLKGSPLYQAESLQCVIQGPLSLQILVDIRSVNWPGEEAAWLTATEAALQTEASQQASLPHGDKRDVCMHVDKLLRWDDIDRNTWSQLFSQVHFGEVCPCPLYGSRAGCKLLLKVTRDKLRTMLVICEANVQEYNSWVYRQVDLFPIAGHHLTC